MTSVKFNNQFSFSGRKFLCGNISITLLLLFFLNQIYSQTVVNITTVGSGSWRVPTNVYCIKVEVLGGGGGGGRSTTAGIAAGGGGAGAYASKLIFVNPNQLINYSVGAGGAGSAGPNAGGDTWFSATTTLMAKGGSGVEVNSQTGGAGGSEATSVGDVKFSGGAGGAGSSGGSDRDAGGGGGAAGAVGNGMNGGPGNNSSATTGTNGHREGGNAGAGYPFTGTGRGGNGTNNSGAGSAAANYGAGGGGGKNPQLWVTNHNGGNGSQGVIKITYTTGQPVTPTFNNPGPICEGTSFTLPTSSTNNPAITGTWSPAINRNTTTTYTFTPAVGQCANTTTMTVVVNPVPIIDPSNAMCVNGSTQTITATPTGGSWTSSNTSVATVSGTGVVTPVAAGTTTITYTLNGCSASRTVTVNGRPTIAINPNPTTICQGTSATLTAGGGTSYSWDSGQNTASITVSPSATTTYTVTGTDANGCVNTATGSVNVTAPINPIFDAIGPICEGTVFTLPTSSTNTPAITGTWSPTPNNTTTTNYTFTPAASECANTITIPVEVTPAPIAAISYAGPFCTSVTAAQSVTHTGTTGGTYSSTSGLTLDATTGAITPSSSTAGTYTVTYTVAAAGGCPSYTTTAQVLITELPVITLTPQAPLCSSSDAVTLVATPTIGTWTGSGVTGSSFNPATATVGTNTLTYTVAAAGGCPAVTETMNVVVNPAPTAAISYAGPFCTSVTAAQVVTHTGTAGGTYTVSPAGLTISTSTGAITPSSSTAGTYTVTYTVAAVGGCPSYTTTAQVIITELPVITLTPQAPLCSSSAAVTLVATPTTGTWSGSGTSGNTFNPATATVGTNTLTYTVAAAGGCPAVTQTMNVTVNPAPTAAISYAGPFCTSVTAAQVVTHTGTTGGTYTVSPAGLTISASTGAITPSSSTAGTYTVTYTVAAAGGCPEFTTTAQVVITELPVISFTTPSDICINTSAITLVATPNGGAFSGNGVTGSQFNPTTSGIGSQVLSYTLPASSGCEAVVANSSINVVDLPAVNAGLDQAICIGSSATLTATGATTYVWNTNATLNTTTSSVVIATPTSTTTYTVTGTDAFGCINSDNVIVQVNQLPTIQVNPTAEVCRGSSISLQAAGANTYSWSSSAGLMNSTGSSIDVSPTVNTIYTVVGIDQNGCENSAQISVSIKELPVAQASNKSICSGTLTDLPLSSNMANTTFSWTVNASGVLGASNGTGNRINQLLTSLTGGTVTYIVTPHSSGCDGQPINVVVSVEAMPNVSITPQMTTICNGSQVTLVATGATNYAWTPTTGLNNATGATVIANPTSTTTYTVNVVTNSGCTGSAQATVVVVDYPVLSFSPTTDKCANESLPIQVFGADSYVWSPASSLNSNTGSHVIANPASTTTYSVTGSISGCSTTDSITIHVRPIPTIDAGVNQEVCKNTSVTLTATGADTYVWNNGITNGVPFNVDSSQTYSVVGSNQFGCSATDFVTVIVNSIPTIDFEADKLSGCAPLHVKFTNSSQGAIRYEWNFGDGEQSMLLNPAHDFNRVGCFDVTLTGYTEKGCSTRLNKTQYICTYPTPVASFTPTRYEISNVINEVYFNNTSTNATIYSWDFDEINGFSAEENPRYEFDPEIIRNHMVTLIASNQFGCVDTAKVLIKMTEDIAFYVPNAFTPDGDNFNNDFKPIFGTGTDSYEYEMLIFNRWGELIFETHDMNVGWDGTYLVNGGQLCPIGTYVWKIVVKKTDKDDRIEKTGHVLLLR